MLMLMLCLITPTFGLMAACIVTLSLGCVCVGGAGAVASFTATAFELCRCGLVDEMDELPAPGSDSFRLFSFCSCGGPTGSES